MTYSAVISPEYFPLTDSVFQYLLTLGFMGYVGGSTLKPCPNPGQKVLAGLHHHFSQFHDISWLIWRSCKKKPSSFGIEALDLYVQGEISLHKLFFWCFFHHFILFLSRCQVDIWGRSCEISPPVMLRVGMFLIKINFEEFLILFVSEVLVPRG